METNPINNLIQTTALKELSKFTGDHNQKVTQFINSVENIGQLTALNDSMLHSIATLKLGGSAYNWYDNNKETLGSWTSLKQHLIERFKPSLSAAKTQLKDRKQQPGEKLLVYYDDVIDLCKQVDSNMPLHMIVDYLQDGIRNDLKLHVKRRLRTLTDDPTPAMFLKIARDEEELQNEVSSDAQHSFIPPQPYFTNITAAIGKPPQKSDNSIHLQRSQKTFNTDRTRSYNRSDSYYPRSSVQPNRYSPCLICNRHDHRSIDCYRKQSSGCYKCGNHNHYLRDCPQVFQ